MSTIKDLPADLVFKISNCLIKDKQFKKIFHNNKDNGLLKFLFGYVPNLLYIEIDKKMKYNANFNLDYIKKFINNQDLKIFFFIEEDETLKFLNGPIYLSSSIGLIIYDMNGKENGFITQWGTIKFNYIRPRIRLDKECKKIINTLHNEIDLLVIDYLKN